MGKRLFILILEFGAGLAGNLSAAYVQQDLWQNAFTLPRILGTVAGAALMLLFLMWLEHERSLAWTWLWHRYWYLKEFADVLEPKLAECARLDVSREPAVSSTPEQQPGKREDLITLFNERLVNSNDEICRALVLGEPGSGKTTGLTHLALEVARSALKHKWPRARMVVLVPLRDYNSGHLVEFVGAAMRHRTQGRSGKVLAAGIEDLLEDGRVCILFDALDEVFAERREAVLAELRIFIESSAYKKVSFVVTARTNESPGERLPELNTFQLQPLDDEGVRTIVEFRKQAGEATKDVLERLERNGFLRPRGLGRNPFWLDLIASSGAYEGGKGRVFNTAIDRLLSREWSKPAVDRMLWRRVLPQHAQVELTKQGLAWLAYHMTLEDHAEIERKATLNKLQLWLNQQPGAAELTPQDIVGFGQDAQVLWYDTAHTTSDSPPIRFRHRLLQDCMAAWAVADDERLQTAAFLSQCLRDTGSWEILLMLGEFLTSLEQRTPAKAHSEDRLHKLINDLMQMPADDRRLLIAAALLVNTKTDAANLMRDLILAFEEAFHAGISAQDRQAATDLFSINGDSSITILARLLSSDKSAIKRTGIELIGAAATRKAAEILVAHLADAEIANDLVDMLASIGQVALEPLLRALRESEPAVRMRAAEALGRIGHDCAIKPLVLAMKSEHPLVATSATSALTRFGPKAVPRLVKTLYKEDTSTRILAARGLGQIGDLRAVGPLLNVLERKADIEVHDECIESLATIGESAVGLILDRLSAKDSPIFYVCEWDFKKFVVRSGEQSIERLAVAQRDLKVDLHIYILNTLEDVIKRGEIHLTPAAIEALLAGLDRSVFPIKVVTAVGGPAVEPLLHLLGQKRGNNSWVTQIIEALGLIGDRRAVEHLLPYLAHTNSSWVREKTVVALGLLGDARATVPLVSTIKDAGYDRALWETPNALVRLGAPAVETLLSLLMTEDPRTKSTLIEVLGKIGDPQAIQPLVEIMRGEEEVLRFNAATALAAFGELAIAPLAAMLEERDTSLVGLAIRTLGGTKRPEALAPLVALLQRKRENLPVDVFWTAIETIAKAQRLEER